MTEIEIDTIEDKLKDIKKYLKKHGIEVTYVEILEVAIRLARRMGAGDWSFVCELKARKER